MDSFVVPFRGIATGTALKTIAQMTLGAGVEAVLKEALVSAQGVTASDVPGEILLARQTSAGTPSGNTTPTPVKWNNPNGIATGVTAVVAGSGAWTAEPTLGDVLAVMRLRPDGMVWHPMWPLDEELRLAASTRLAVVATFAATVNLTGFLRFSPVAA